MKAQTITIVFALMVSHVVRSSAATYTVTTTNDTGPNSLRAVITTANGVAGPHAVDFANTGHFAGGGTINLVSPLPVITQSVTIAGWRNPGSTNNAITVAGSPFVFAPGTSNILNQLNIDGSITNGQSISITGCVITNGGIRSTGVLQMISSSIIASPTAGIWSSGNATLNGVTVSQCKAGGIHNEGTMVIAGSIIASNSNPSGGGGIHSINSLQVSDTRIRGNWTTNFQGGGVYSSGTAAFIGCMIINNSSTGIGGGVFGASNLTLTASTIASNTVQGTAGGAIGGVGSGGAGGSIYPGNLCFSPNYYYWLKSIAGSGGLFAGKGGEAYTSANIGQGGVCWATSGAAGGPGGGPALGGGIHFTDGLFQMTNCTLSGNTATGGNGLHGGIGGADFRGGGGGGGSGVGGAVFLANSTAYLVNCTVAGNTTVGGAGGSAGGNGAQAGVAAIAGPGGIFSISSSCYLLNTIVANNTPSSPNPDVYGTISSAGYNFVGNSAGSSGWNPVNDYQNAVPLSLGPLQDNGGPTLTCALLPGSLCIQAGTSTGAPLTDQRGVIRPLGKCDIGAYQYTTLITTSVTWTNPAPIVYSTPLSSVQLNASANAGGTFSYIPPAGTVLNAGSNQVLTALFTPSDPTSYTGASNVVFITVLKTNQTINFPTIPPQTVNAPPILLNATASSGLPVSYALISGDALLAGNLLSVGSTPGQVVVRASQAGNGNYLAATDVEQSFLVVSGSRPSITTQPTNQTVDLGGNAAFYVAATTSPLTYQWQFQSLDMPGETNQSLSLLRVKASQAGPYRVIVSNPIGSVTSLVAVLTVNVPPGVPAITSQPKSLSVRSGETASFAVGATGNAPLVFQWYRGVSGDTNNPVGVNRPDYTTGALTANASYWVSVKNSLGMVDSDTAWVTVVPSQTPKLSFQILAGFPVITLDGKVGTNYVLQYKNNLSDPNWTLLLNFTLSANPFTYFDTTATGQQRRYYRAYAY